MGCSCGGNSPIHRFSSANKASKSCPLVGAVTTTLLGKRSKTYHSIAQLADVDLPVPCPDLIDILRSPSANACKNSLWYVRGSAPKTSTTNFTGSSRYSLTKSSKGLDSLIGHFLISRVNGGGFTFAILGINGCHLAVHFTQGVQVHVTD